MKKLLALLVIACLVVMATSAFAEEDKQLRWGIKGGFTMMNIWGDEAQNTSWAYGGGGGVFMNYRFNEYFVLQPEAMWAWKGFKVKHDVAPDIEIDITTKVYYIDVNALAKITVPMEGMVKPHLLIGPYVGFKIGDGWSMDPDPPAEYADDVEQAFDDMLDQTRTTDFGVDFGAGLDYMLSSGGMITFDVRYALGLVKLFENDEGADPDMKHQLFQIFVGYGF
jgi:opacity protein-like surface antigen